MITERFVQKKPVIRHHIRKHHKKTTMLSFYFERPLSIEEASMGSLLGKILSSSSMDYPDIKSISEKEQYLYGSYHYFDMDKYGDKLFFIYKIVIPSYRILKDEEAFEEALSFYHNLLYRPNITGDSFEERNFNHEKKMLIQSLETLKKDPYGYAHRSLINLIFGEHPLGVYKYGSTEVLKKITGDNLYNYYKNVLVNSDVYAYAHGDVEEVRILEEHFKDHKALEFEYGTFKELTEEVPGSQSILVQAYHLGAKDDEEVHANLLLDRILGGHAGSILFKKLREEKQYCYTVYTKYDRYRALLFLTLGFNEEYYEDILKDLDQILEELPHNLTEEDLIMAKKDAKGTLLSLYDSQSSLVEYTFLSDFFKRADTLEGRVEKVEHKKLEDIRSSLDRLRAVARVHLVGGKRD